MHSSSNGFFIATRGFAVGRFAILGTDLHFMSISVLKFMMGESETIWCVNVDG